jgi:hypothetical protein
MVEFPGREDLESLEERLEHEKQRLKDSGCETLEWLREDFAPAELAEKHPWVLAMLAAGVAAVVAGGLGYWSGRNSRETRED